MLGETVETRKELRQKKNRNKKNMEQKYGGKRATTPEMNWVLSITTGKWWHHLILFNLF